MNPTLLLLDEAIKEGKNVYSFGKAVGVALFTWAVVFAVLFIIFAIIRIFGAVVSSLSKEKEQAPTANPSGAVVAPAEDPGEEFSSGSLKLKNCDEKTAAMIMAIVSDNTGIPLNELIFKSISLVENK